MLIRALLALLAPSPAPKIDPAALALLAHSARATFALRTYQAECRSDVIPDDPKARNPERLLATLRAAKPNKMRYERWDLDAAEPWTKPDALPSYVFACAGDVLHQQFGAIVQDGKPNPDGLRTILEPWDGFYSPAVSPYQRFVEMRTKGDLREARLAGTETVDGVLCRRVSLAAAGSYGGRSVARREIYSIGSDGLVRRQVSHVSFDGAPGLTTSATLIHILKNAPIEEATYAYRPPPGVKRMADLPIPALLASGTPAPDFTATDSGGKSVRLSDLRGKVVVVDFWAAWCAPCMASLPHTQDVVARLQKEGLPVVLLGVDDAETREAYLRVARGVGAKYPNLRLVHVAKAGSVSGPYRVSSIPTQYVVGPDGTVRATLSGYAGPTDDLEKAARGALAP